MWCCNNCGNYDGNFVGYQKYTEWGTEGIIVDSNGEVLDYAGRKSDDSEINETNIETCEKCSSTEISDVGDSELEEWKLVHFNHNGEFNKEGAISPISKSKMQILTDELLNDTITIQEYRQRKTEIVGSNIGGK